MRGQLAHLVEAAKRPNVSIQFFTPGEWDAFRGGMKDGEFDN